MEPILFLIYLLGWNLGGSSYISTRSDIPLLEHKNEARLDLGLTILGAHANGAYSFTEHWAVQGGVNSLEQLGGIFTVGQCSLGWYDKLGSGVLESYAGASFGHFNNNGFNPKYDYAYSHITNSQTYYLQVNYGWNNLASNHIDLAFGLKTGFAAFQSTISSSYLSLDENGNVVVEGPVVTHSKVSSLVLEPIVEARVGWERIKFSFLASFPILKQNPHLLEDSRFQMGLNYYFKHK